MKYNSLKATTVALALTLFASANVYATTSTISVSAPLVLSSLPTTFSHTFTKDGSFSDTFTFNVNSGLSGTFSANVASQFTTLFGNQLYGIDITSFNLSGSANINGVETSTTWLFGTLHNDIWSLGGVLSAGNYVLNVQGKADVHPLSPFSNLMIPTSYRGSATLAVSPVPEVETSSMMLLGLGLMGYIVRRRKI